MSQAKTKAQSLVSGSYNGKMSFKIPGTTFYLSHAFVMTKTQAEFFNRPFVRSHLGGGADNPKPPNNAQCVWLANASGAYPPGNMWRDIGGTLGTIHQTAPEGEDQEAFYFAQGSTSDRVKIRSQWSKIMGQNDNGQFVLGHTEADAVEFEVILGRHFHFVKACTLDAAPISGLFVVILFLEYFTLVYCCGEICLNWPHLCA